MNYRNINCLLSACALLFSSSAISCSISATGFQFGAIDPLQPGDTVSTSSLIVDCPAPTSYTIALSAGAGSFAERHMSNGNNRLLYNLYVDASHSTVWGDGTGITQLVTGSSDAAGRMHTVYGRIPHQPTAVPGIYSDLILVTLSF